MLIGYCYIFLEFSINSLIQNILLFYFRACRYKVISSKHGQVAPQDTDGRLVAARKMSLGELLQTKGPAFL